MAPPSRGRDLDKGNKVQGWMPHCPNCHDDMLRKCLVHFVLRNLKNDYIGCYLIRSGDGSQEIIRHSTMENRLKTVAFYSQKTTRIHMHKQTYV